MDGPVGAPETLDRPHARGHFGPDSVLWRISRESVVLLGGGRALILQMAHPGVAAGVAEHSNYREDPWGRAYRSVEVALRIVFGDPESSRRAAQQLKRVHARVNGTDDRGRPYSARDPELLMWVHATLFDTALEIYDRYVGCLGEDARVRAWGEAIRTGEMYGIPRDRQPRDYAAFRRYWDRMLDRGLRITAVTREVTDLVLNPPLPRVAFPVVEAMRLVTVGTLPGNIRRRLGLSWGPGRERLLGASEAAVRGIMPLLPDLVRSVPPARAAGRRVASAGRA
jgi:uncharacterized protein (DUF2236 family)